MKIAEAITRFLDQARLNDSTVQSHLRVGILDQALALLTEYLSKNAELSELTLSRLRDFLSRWYVEKASGSTPTDSAPRLISQVSNALPTDCVPAELLDSIVEFVGWADQQTDAHQAPAYSALLNELRRSLPRALAITNALTAALRARGGAFTFPEFLTSFEEGGSSQYDVDGAAKVGAIDGYFRIIRVEGFLVEAEELISEERLWPIVFPAEAAELLGEGYIINLELVRNPEGWRIAGCGFAYPPGTEVG
jgi:hypothetical protein